MMLCTSAAYVVFTEFEYHNAFNSEIAHFWLKLSVFWPFVLSFILHFVLVFTEQTRLLKRKLTYLIIYLPGVIFFLLDMNTHLLTGEPIKAYWGWTSAIPRNSISYICTFWQFAIICLSLYLCWRYYLLMTDHQKKMQAKHITVGLSIPGVLFVFTEVLTPFLPFRIPPLSNLGLVIGGIFIAYAIYRYRLFILTPKIAAESIIATMPDILLLCSSDHKIVLTNDAASKLLGFTNRELIGQPVANIFSKAEDEKLIFETYEVKESKDIIRSFETAFKIKTGNSIPVALSVSTIRDNEGRLQGVVCIGRDITERKQSELALRESEKKYRILVETVQEGIGIVDPEENIIFANQAFANLLGFERNELIGKNLREITDQEEFAKYKNETIKRKKRLASKYETRLYTKEKKPKYFAVSAAPIYEGENFVGALALLSDITERKKLEAELLKMSKLESVGMLAGGIAHDFNNILTAILGNITLAKMYVKPEDKVFAKLDEAEKASFRAKDLTQQLLTFAKGGAPLKRSVSITKLLKDTTHFALSGSKVSCKFSIAEDLALVDIDEGQMSQVINNLVINAVQAMPNEGIIEMRAENTVVMAKDGLPLRPGDYIRISVKDHGVGMPEENLTKIFDPYFTTKPTGRGLGLSIAYSIIKNHEGYIMAKSKLGVGSTFYIYLPVSKQTEKSKDIKEEKVFFGQGRILVMEDDKAIQDVMADMLKHLGYEVVFAPNSTEAIEQYKKAKDTGSRFDAVILDLTIVGGKGGKSAIKELIEFDPNVKAIVYSGYSHDPVMANFKKFGFSGIISKPFKIEEISAVLHEIIKDK